MSAPMIALAAMLAACTAIDGDTIRCGREHVRLVGIDAPEMPGHCRRGRACVQGSGPLSRRVLAEALRGGPIRIWRQGRDRYGRTLARVAAGGIDLSCHQLAAGGAIYVGKWDRGGAVARDCRVR